MLRYAISTDNLEDIADLDQMAWSTPCSVKIFGDKTERDPGQTITTEYRDGNATRVLFVLRGCSYLPTSRGMVECLAW